MHAIYIVAIRAFSEFKSRRFSSGPAYNAIFQVKIAINKSDSGTVVLKPVVPVSLFAVASAIHFVKP